MKLNNLNGLKSIQPTNRPSEPMQPKDGMQPERSSVTSGADRVRVSSRAEEASRFIARAGEMGDIRQERVSSIREAIQSNQYKVSSSRIADAIMRWEKAA